MSLIVDLEGVNEQVQEASRFLEKHKGSADDHKLLKATTALVKDNKLYDAVVMLLDEAKDIFEGQEKGVENWFSLMLTLAAKVEEKGADLLNRILEEVSSNQSKPHLRLTILGNMYNLITDRVLRQKTLSRILSFAYETKQVDAVIPALESAFEKLSEDKENDELKRTLLKNAYYLLKDAKHELSYKVAIQYLNSLGGATSQEVAEAKTAIASILADFVVSKSHYVFDELLNNATIKSVASSESTLWGLLDILANKTVNDLNQYWNANAASLEAHGITKEDVYRKMRLLSLLSLINSLGPAPTVSYKTVAENLGIPEDEVEQCVVDAIEDELVEARFDQLTDTIHFSYAMQRAFRDDQWKQLRTQLHAWKSTIQGMLQVIDSVKQKTATAH